MTYFSKPVPVKAKVPEGQLNPQEWEVYMSWLKASQNEDYSQMDAHTRAKQGVEIFRQFVKDGG